MPKRDSVYTAGYDVYLLEELTIKPGERKKVTINEDLLDSSKFAGNYNIPHIIRQIKVYKKMEQKLINIKK